MMFASDKTAPTVMEIETSVGIPPGPRSLLNGADDGTLTPEAARPATTNTSTGTTIVPIAPSGSRMKILISIQVS